ncbi:MAG: FRG domain-containing protein [Bacteroidia bacterium]|nr:FRG domain-containing protein [Bacteroidia bacterium]
MANRSQDKKIESVKMFVDEITSLRRDRTAANAEEWFFRGQKNSGWEVRPYIFRGDDLASEHILIDRAQRQNPVEFRNCVNNFEILTKLQHYGLGTRLLDVTLNPLVALFFATEPSDEYIENKNGQYSRREHDGIVYFRLVNGCALQDLQIRIALSIPFVEFGKSMSLEVFCLRLLEQDTISRSEYERLITDDYSEIIRIIQTNSFIISTNSNIRLIQQRGAFLLAPAINLKTNIDVKTSILSKAKTNLAIEFEGYYTIPVKAKNDIRAELNFFNVNEATLFPELEHQMNYIQRLAQQAVGTVEEYRQYAYRTYSQTPVEFDRMTPDVDGILKKVLPTINAEHIEVLRAEINTAIATIDWHLKDSIISGLRRSITNVLADMFSAVEAKSKAKEVVEELIN